MIFSEGLEEIGADEILQLVPGSNCVILNGCNDVKEARLVDFTSRGVKTFE